MGLDPSPYTLAQLQTMARGRQRSQWAQTSTVLALLANAHRDPKRRPYPFEPWDFDPFAEPRAPRGIPWNKENGRILAQLLTGKQPAQEKPSRWDMLNS